jgi:hypothetical protein
MDEEIIRQECELHIVVHSVDIIVVGEGIGRTHQGPRGVMEMQVEVLQEKVPVCLTPRQFVGWAEICQVLVVREQCREGSDTTPPGHG